MNNLWGFHVDHRDIFISYLPAAHVYEFAMECFLVSLGASIGFYQVTIATLFSLLTCVSDQICNACLGIEHNLHGWYHDEREVLYSYLPAAHVYQYTLENYMGIIAGSIGFSQVPPGVTFSVTFSVTFLCNGLGVTIIVPCVIDSSNEY